MRRLECNIEKNGAVVVVRPMGRLDSGQADRFEKLLADEVRKGNHRMVLDMSELTFIASSALRIMLMTARAIKGREGMFLVAGPLPHIMDVMRTAGFDRLLDIKVTTKDGVEAARDPDEEPEPEIDLRPEPRTDPSREMETAREQAQAARAAEGDDTADEAEEAEETPTPKPARKRRRGRLMRVLAAMWKALTSPEPDEA